MEAYEVARSITLFHLLFSLFRFPEGFASLQASHLFITDTAQYFGGLRSSAHGTSFM